jgi:hypothetical protein
MMLAIPLGLIAAGCGNDNDDHPNVVPDLSGIAVADAGVPHQDASAAGDGAVTGSTQVRIAHLSPDSSPLDICIAPTGTTNFSGPLIVQSGLAGGISYANVTRYLTMTSGTFDIRVTAGGIDGCSVPFVPDTLGVVFPSGGTLTVALMGESAAAATTPFIVKRFVDDTTAASGQAALRYIQAAPELGTVDVGTVVTTTFTPLFSAVPYPNFVTGVGIDAQGYLTTAPLVPPTTIGVRKTGTATFVSGLLPDPPGVPANGVRTLFTIGGNTDGTTLMPNQPLQGFLCGDNLGPSATNSFLSNCITFALN